MRLLHTRLRRGRYIPGRGAVSEGADLGPAEVHGSWVIVTVTTPAGPDNVPPARSFPVLLWGDEIAPSEVDADPVLRGQEAPARGRARPPGAEGT